VDDALQNQSQSPGAVGPLRPIFALGAPLIGFYLIQTAINVATVGMLGRLGDAAIAGVGAGSAIFTAICALLWGVDTGVQAVVSRTTGAGRAERIAEVLAGAYTGAIPLAAVVAAGAWALGPKLVALVLPDHAAAAAGGAWIAAAAPSIVFLALTLPINAAWIGSGRPAFAMAVTLLSAPVQIALTMLLVLGGGPMRGLGAVGSAMAMDATMLGAVGVQFALALRFIPGFLRARPRGLIEIAAIGWPIGTQQSLLQWALMGIFAIIAQLGAAPAAIASVLVTLTNAPGQIETGFAVAAATLVGQALGGGDAALARGWGWRTTLVAIVVTAPMGLALMLAPQALLSAFLRDPATLAMALGPGRIAGFATAIGAPAAVLGFAFRGAGATKIAAVVPFASLWLVQLPLTAWVGLGLHAGLTGIVWVQAAVVAVDGLALAALWSGSAWTRVRIDSAAAQALLPTTLRRIAIMGGAGAGKSTLARRLGDELGLPVIHLDRLAYGPGWARRGSDAMSAGLAPLLEDSWIVDGTYGEASSLTLPAADLVLWLEQPVWLRLFRAWRKTRVHRGRPRADRPDGCEEAFGWRYAAMVFRFGAWTQERAAQMATAAGQVRRVRGDRAVVRLVEEVARTQSARS
jgi:putative MATE family efflux protein